jgi:hypothetical protein
LGTGCLCNTFRTAFFTSSARLCIFRLPNTTHFTTSTCFKCQKGVVKGGVAFSLWFLYLHSVQLFVPPRIVFRVRSLDMVTSISELSVEVSKPVLKRLRAPMRVVMTEAAMALLLQCKTEPQFTYLPESADGFRFRGLSDIYSTAEAKLVRTEKGMIVCELCFSLCLCIALQQKCHCYLSQRFPKDEDEMARQISSQSYRLNNLSS